VVVVDVVVPVDVSVSVVVLVRVRVELLECVLDVFDVFDVLVVDVVVGAWLDDSSSWWSWCEGCDDSPSGDQSCDDVVGAVVVSWVPGASVEVVPGRTGAPDDRAVGDRSRAVELLLLGAAAAFRRGPPGAAEGCASEDVASLAWSSWTSAAPDSWCVARPSGGWTAHQTPPASIGTASPAARISRPRAICRRRACSRAVRRTPIPVPGVPGCRRAARRDAAAGDAMTGEATIGDATVAGAPGGIGTPRGAVVHGRPETTPSCRARRPDDPAEPPGG
jgi:hypothetical protein